MILHSVENKEQLEAYYSEKNLQTVEEKIKHLTKAMKIRAIRCDEAETLEEALGGLEEMVMFGSWRAFWQ